MTDLRLGRPMNRPGGSCTDIAEILVRNGLGTLPGLPAGVLPEDVLPRSREGVPAKARRYLTEGRLRVLQVSGDRVGASCRGQGAVYELGHERGTWHCSCLARTRCAHLEALMLVVAVEEGEKRAQQVGS